MADLHFFILHDKNRSLGNAKTVLEDWGYNVDDVKNAEELLKQRSSYDCTVIMVDISIPDGIIFLKEIVKSKTTEWIIAVTESKQKKSAFTELGSEICAYLNKPVDIYELKQLVNNIVEVCSLRKEVSDKTKRVSHLEVVNEIIRETLLSRDEEALLWTVARLINIKLFFYNVNIFLIDEHNERAVLKAFSGGFDSDLVVGYSLGPGEGIVGWVAQNRQPLLAGDVRKESRRIKGFEFEEDVLSELGVPIIFEDKVIGVIHVDSEKLNAFSHDDVIALETIADQLALAFEMGRLSRKLLDAYQLSTALNDSLPVSIVLLERDLKIIYVNNNFCETIDVCKDDIVGAPIQNYFSDDLFKKIDFPGLLIDVFETGVTVSYPNIRHTSPNHSDKVLNISFVRVQAGINPLVMILLQDVTEYSRKTYQLSMLREISIVMQGVFERDKLLHLILTSVTAGFAMGFNRAFLFLVDNNRDKLEGIMGVGPSSQEEASKIWYELSQTQFTFQDYLDKFNRGEIFFSSLNDSVKNITFDLKNTRNILTETVNTGHHMHVVNAWENPGVDESMKELIVTNEFITIPLIAKNEVIGVLFADNAYSGKPITQESINELTMFAAPAALAIEKTYMLCILEEKINELEKAYIELEKTHDMLIRHEKLAAIGEISARLAHEIRNPLATIGGFAKSIPLKYDNKKRTIRNAKIIIKEVQRLENILSNVLDFTKASTPRKTVNDINELVKDTLRIMEGYVVTNNIVVALDLAEEELKAEFDSSQIKQVLINVIKNAFNSMQDGGALEIKTSVMDGYVHVDIRDTGKGIPEMYLDAIFDPFFTTNGNGTGLGLSISQRIMQNHNGSLEISSVEGKGTTVSVILPCESKSLQLKK